MTSSESKQMKAELEAAKAAHSRAKKMGEAVLRAIASERGVPNCSARGVLAKRKAMNAGTSAGVKKSWLRRRRGGPPLSPSEHSMAERWNLEPNEIKRIKRFLAGKQTSAEFHALSEMEQAAISDARKEGYLVSKDDRWVEAHNTTSLAAVSPSPMIGKYATGTKQKMGLNCDVENRTPVRHQLVMRKMIGAGSKYEEAKHPRLKGKWTNKPGGGAGPLAAQHSFVQPKKPQPVVKPRSEAPSAPKPLGDKQKARLLARQVFQAKGFTYHPIMEKSPTEGFVVSAYKKHELIIKPDQFRRMKTNDLGGVIRRHLRSAKDTFASDDKAHLGGFWDVTDGTMFLDVVQVFDDKDKALEQGKKLNERSIFDLGKKDVISCNRGGKRLVRFIFPRDATPEQMAEALKELAEKRNDDEAENRSPIPGQKPHDMSQFDLAQLAAGTRVEKEHTSDPQLARQIAMDHLAEDPEYYRKLKRCVEN